MTELDEVDLALLDALHRRPLASYETLSRGLGLDATTVARRWRALVAQGLAWVSSAPGPAAPVVWATYEARCAPRHVDAVAAALAARPRVASVHVLSGSWSIYALLVAVDVGAVAALVHDLGETPGILAARSTVCLQVHRSVGWHLDALDPAQQTSVTAAPTPDRHGAPVVFGPADRAIHRALQPDGRASHRDLAEVLGRSPAAVRRRLTALRSAGHLVSRTDFARAHGGWPVQVRVLLSVPDEEVAAVGAVLGAWPQVRVCLTVLGAANLVLTVQVHALSEVTALLVRIASASPAGQVVDRALVLRSVKSWGRLLDDEGRAIGLVPVDPWDGRPDPARTASPTTLSGDRRAGDAPWPGSPT